MIYPLTPLIFLIICLFSKDLILNINLFNNKKKYFKKLIKFKLKGRDKSKTLKK